MELRLAILLAVLAAALGVAAGAAGYALAVAATAPSCPVEDVCRPVYDDDGWRIVEVTP